MKKLIFTLIAAAGVQGAVAQDFQAPIDRGERAVRDTPRVEDPATGVGGAIPRAMRSGNPLQMINPRAPLQYGTGYDLVSYEQSDPFMRPHERKVRPQGIRLFSIQW